MLNALSVMGAAVHKSCMDIRMSQANKELMEPFEADQVIKFHAVLYMFIMNNDIFILFVC